MGVSKHCPQFTANSIKKDDSRPPKRPSFFKIILDNEFLDTLFLPPAFANKVTSLANKTIQIADRAHRQWPVTLSYVEDKLAFVQGWSTFALDHGIVPTDLLTFHHISGSDFVCEIFSKNACAKVQFPSYSCNAASMDPDDRDSSKLSSSRRSPGKGMKRKYFEDPCWMVIREADFVPSGDRSYLLDLSVFEMSTAVSNKGSSSLPDGLVHNSDFDEAMRTSCDVGNKDRSEHVISGQNMTSVEAQTAAFQGQLTTIRDQGPSRGAQTATLRDEGPPGEAQKAGLQAQAAFQDVRDPKNFGNEIVRSVTTPKKERKKVNAEGFGASVRISEGCKKSNPVGLGGSVRNVKEEHNMFNPKRFGASAGIIKKEPTMFNPKALGQSLEAQAAPFHARGHVGYVKNEHKVLNPEGIEGVRIVKEARKKFDPKSVGGIVQRVQKRLDAESFGNNHNSNGEHQENGTSHVLKRVKTEAVDFVETPSPRAFTCPVASDSDFLVLPMDFSLLGYRIAMNVEKKVILLRDSSQKLWPLLCCKTDGLQVLTSGWKSFREANKVKTGDECVFEVEDKFANIFKVNVVRKV